MTVRRGAQAFCLAAFVWFVCSGRPVIYGEWLFRGDMTVVAGASVAAAVAGSALLFSLGLFAGTLLFGRVFCGWICPLGTLGDAVGEIFRVKPPRRSVERTKYHLLVLFGFLAAGGLSLFWILDPLNWAARILGGFSVRFIEWTWLLSLGAAFVGIHFLWGRRAFCRVLCPLGAGLAVTSRFAAYRRHFYESACIDCDACVKQCRTGAIGSSPAIYDPMECVHCGHCTDVCPTDALAFDYLRPKLPSPPQSAPRREFLGSAVAGMVAAVGLRVGGGPGRKGAPILRPPGSAKEEDFIDLCIRCGSCSRVCPTSTLVPAGLEHGVAGFQAPVLVPTAGGCAHGCTACGEVCPTGAIRPLFPEEKARLRLGTAEVDETRCLAIARGQVCLSCVASCPYEAIHLRPGSQVAEWGDRVGHPVVDPDRCTGCGLCERWCPAGEVPAIRVAAAAIQTPLPEPPEPFRLRREPDVEGLFPLPPPVPAPTAER